MCTGPAPWQCYLQEDHIIDKQYPCTICKSLKRLLYTAIIRGFNVDECRVKVYFYNATKLYPATLIDHDSIQGLLGWRLTSNDCCYLSLLELLLHCGADIQNVLQAALEYPSESPHDSFLTKIVKLMLDPIIHYSETPWPSSISPYTQDLLLNFWEAVLRYHPALCQHFLSSLSVTSHLPENVPGVRQRLLQLEKLTKSPRSLKLLTRLCILKNLTS